MAFIDGKLPAATRASGDHTCERSSALGQCRYASRTATSITRRGSLGASACAKRCVNSGSSRSCAVPLTRSTSFTPGIKNSRPMRGSASRFSSVSSRLLPVWSGISNVRSSATCTKPGRPPRGDESSPSPAAPALAMTHSGACATKRRMVSSSRSSCLARERGDACGYRRRRVSAESIISACFEEYESKRPPALVHQALTAMKFIPTPAPARSPRHRRCTAWPDPFSCRGSSAHESA